VDILKNNKTQCEVLRVENQQTLNEMQYERAVHDSREAAQYEQRIRDLAAEIEESERRAADL
jgi:hypothetical protein